MERLKLAFYYNRLAWRDLVRLWPTTQHHVIIVAGICLPILLLLGLKRGHVADLRRELLTSPSGRQVVFWSAQQGELLDATATKRLQADIPNVELIIPEQERLVRISSAASTDDATVTLYSTVSGDPILKQVGADIGNADERSIILAHAVAQRLKLVPGDKLKLKVERRRDSLDESAELEVTLHAILPDSGDKQALVGYADRRLLDKLEQYVRGFRVESFQWPAIKAAVRDKYSAYLAFCEAGNDYRESDLDTLKERGLVVTPLADAEERSLFGAMKTDDLGKLRIYKIASISSESDPLRRLILAPSDIAETTAADDVVVPWNKPQLFQIGDGTVRLVGLSLPNRCWLREYLIAPETAFAYDAPTFSARAIEDRFALSFPSSTLPISLSNGSILSLTIVASSKPTPVNQPVETRSTSEALETKNPDESKETKPATPEAKGSTEEVNESSTDKQLAATDTPASKSESKKNEVQSSEVSVQQTAIVPADLLAQLDAFQSGVAEYDSLIGMFVPRAESPIYSKARAYAFTIDEVPNVVSALSSRGFAVESQNGRIMEIHEQDNSLQILVWVVGIGVFLFGVITTVSVLTDSTDRKRGTIGILRVMGVSRIGVFYVTVLRAAVIGLLAGLTAAGVGYALAWFLGWTPSPQLQYLSWKPQVTVLLHPIDLAMVFAGALICSGLGALLPAWKASRLDPFDAIVEGRFR